MIPIHHGRDAEAACIFISKSTAIAAVAALVEGAHGYSFKTFFRQLPL